MDKPISPKRVIFYISLSILACELIIMYFLAHAPSNLLRYQMILDPIILVILLSPVLFILIYRPMQTAVTKCREAENALLVKSRNIRQYLDIAGVMILVIDIDQNVSLINKKGCEILGYNENEIIGRKWFDNFVPENSRDTVKDAFINLLLGRVEPVDYFQSSVLTKAGQERLIAWHNSFIRSPKGNILSMLCSGEDITERRKTDEDLLRRDYQLEILSRTSVHINAVLEVPVIMRTLVASAMELVGAQGGTSGLLVGGKMVFTEYNKEGIVHPINYAFERGKGIPGWVMNTMKPYFTNDAEHDPSIMPETRKEFSIYNLATVPIISRKAELMGVFEIHNKIEKRPFDVQDMFMLRGLAASAAVALENAEMLKELK